MSKDEQEAKLRNALDAAGVEYDGRWGVEKLQDALDASQEAAPTASPPPASAGVLCRVLRDFWPTDDPLDRVRKGAVVEVTVEQALDGVEAGALQRVR